VVVNQCHSALGPMCTRMISKQSRLQQYQNELYIFAIRNNFRYETSLTIY